MRRGGTGRAKAARGGPDWPRWRRNQREEDETVGEKGRRGRGQSKTQFGQEWRQLLKTKGKETVAHTRNNSYLNFLSLAMI